MIPIGSHVQARWSNGQFYGGVVVQGDGYQYLIQWDDGSEPMWVAAGDVMAEGMMGAPMMGKPMMGMPMAGGMGAAPIGSHVQARWTNGQFYGATVVQFNGAQYLVQWDDGSAPLWVAAHDVMPDAKMGAPMMGKPMAGAMMGGMSPGEMMGGMMGGMGGYGVGSHVQARWTNGQFYGGTVVQNNGAACMIQWDDGSSPLWVAMGDIMPG